MIRETIELMGLNGKDKVTGLKGVISSVAFDLYGCVQVVLTPPMGKDGKVEHGTWFDANRIEVQKGKRVMSVPDFDGKAVQPADYTQGAAEKPVPRGC